MIANFEMTFSWRLRRATPSTSFDVSFLMVICATPIVVGPELVDALVRDFGFGAVWLIASAARRYVVEPPGHTRRDQLSAVERVVAAYIAAFAMWRFLRRSHAR